MAYGTGNLFKKVRTYLSTHPGTTLSQVAVQFGVDRHTIERAVRMESGDTFRQLQQRLRSDMAKRLLLEEPNLSVKQISAMVGFKAARAFARSFRCAVGVSPMQFRKQSSGPKHSQYTSGAPHQRLEH